MYFTRLVVPLMLVRAALAFEHVLRVHNASQVELQCMPAEHFVRSNMAPDFESPQLVRELSWFHDEMLVASFKSQHGITGEKWVTGLQYELLSPFFALKVNPVRPEDTGVFSCRLETDPLFPAVHTQAHVSLLVMTRPDAPSAPIVKATSSKSVTLSWTHSTSLGQRPIISYTVAVKSLNDTARFEMLAPSNTTTVIVDNLIPNTEYAFSISATNEHSRSDFGPHTTFTTPGTPPTTPPDVLIGQMTSRCFELTVQTLHEGTSHLRLTLSYANASICREEKLPAAARTSHKVCRLRPFTRYGVSVVAVSPYGASPPFLDEVTTDQERPGSAPRDVRVDSVFGKASLTVAWSPPLHQNGLLTTYQIYQLEEGSAKWKSDVLRIKGRDEKKRYKVEIKGLQPATSYTIQVSASNSKGESDKSKELTASTDITAPSLPTMDTILYACGEPLILQWTESANGAVYTVELTTESDTLQLNTTSPKIELKNLPKHQEYSAQVRAQLPSIVKPGEYVKGAFSKPERFILSDSCNVQSSLCPPKGRLHCLPLLASAELMSRPVSPLIVFSAMLFFLLTVLLAAFFIKRFHRCLGVKRLLKKKEKSVLIEELSPLVYDAIGCEEIPVELFYGYCEDLARDENAKYSAQFDQVERLTNDFSEKSDEFMRYGDKNRYANIAATETSRVRLAGIADDYINANFVDSTEKRNAYIATQAPLPSTFGDFYAMLWQERTNVVLMIANLEEHGLKKCDQYWPATVHAAENYGNFQVTLVSQSTCAHYIHRILSIRILKCVPQTERRVQQLQFTGWPDHGVPSSPFPLLSFVHAVAELHSTGPIVVHCSAGVGRSGSFIVVDSMRRRLLSHRSLNLVGHLVHIRKQRQHLVQNVEQFIFCHEAVRQLIRHGITRVRAAVFPKYIRYLTDGMVSGKTRMQLQFDDLCKCTHSPACAPTADTISLPGFHRLDEFLVGGWSAECDAMWRTVWTESVHTILLIGDRKHFWHQTLSVGEELSLVWDSDTVILSDGDAQLKVLLLSMDAADFDADTWGRIEAVQAERPCSHDRPLLVVAPLSADAENGHDDNNDDDDDQDARPKLADMRAFLFCALTSLACQFEQQGCVDVVQTLALYSQRQCGLWRARRHVEFIYERALQLIMISSA